MLGYIHLFILKLFVIECMYKGLHHKGSFIRLKQKTRDYFLIFDKNIFCKNRVNIKPI